MPLTHDLSPWVGAVVTLRRNGYWNKPGRDFSATVKKMKIKGKSKAVIEATIDGRVDTWTSVSAFANDMRKGPPFHGPFGARVKGNISGSEYVVLDGRLFATLLRQRLHTNGRPQPQDLQIQSKSDDDDDTAACPTKKRKKRPISDDEDDTAASRPSSMHHTEELHNNDVEPEPVAAANVSSHPVPASAGAQPVGPRHQQHQAQTSPMAVGAQPGTQPTVAGVQHGAHAHSAGCTVSQSPSNVDTTLPMANSTAATTQPAAQPVHQPARPVCRVVTQASDVAQPFPEHAATPMPCGFGADCFMRTDQLHESMFAHPHPTPQHNGYHHGTGYQTMPQNWRPHARYPPVSMPTTQSTPRAAAAPNLARYCARDRYEFQSPNDHFCPVCGDARRHV